MTINLLNNRLIVTFKYDPKIVAVVKKIPGRVFNARMKRWETPVNQIEEALRLLEPLGLNATLAVKQELRRARAIVIKVEEARKNPEAYGGDLPLYDFQKIGAAFLKAIPGGLLADAPGLGKTIQTIAALENFGRVLVFCPASLKYSWRNEIFKWTKKSATVIDGKKEERNNFWANAENQYTIANYELLLRDLPEILKTSWGAVVCDEATRISNHTAKTVKLLKQIPCQKRIALTGTPISNTPKDLYSIIDWLSPGYFGNFWLFQNEYCVLDPYWNNIVGYKNLGQLSAKIAPFLLRRTKEEVLPDLPKKTIQDVIFPLSNKEKDLYRAIQEEIFEEIKYLTVDKTTIALIMTKMLRLLQLTDHPKLLGSDIKSSKLETLKDILEPILNN